MPSLLQISEILILLLDRTSAKRLRETCKQLYSDTTRLGVVMRPCPYCPVLFGIAPGGLWYQLPHKFDKLYDMASNGPDIVFSKIFYDDWSDLGEPNSMRPAVPEYKPYPVIAQQGTRLGMHSKWILDAFNKDNLVIFRANSALDGSTVIYDDDEKNQDYRVSEKNLELGKKCEGAPPEHDGYVSEFTLSFSIVPKQRRLQSDPKKSIRGEICFHAKRLTYLTDAEKAIFKNLSAPKFNMIRVVGRASFKREQIA